MSYHKIKFFPKYNAYVISPAPTHNDDGGVFGWNFNPDYAWIVEWDRSDLPSNYKVYVEFIKSHGDRSDRKHPVSWVKGAHYLDNMLVGDETHNQIEFGLAKSESGIHWKFNFKCGDFSVDPEIKIVTGSI